MQIKMKLDTIDKVKEFTDYALLIPEELTVHSGKYSVDAKSIMGLFSLDLTKPLYLEIEAKDGRAAEIAGIFQKFIIEF